MTNLAIWFEANAMPIIMTFSATLSALLVTLTPLIVAVKRLRRNSDWITSASAAVIAENAVIKADSDKYRALILRQARDISEIKEICRIAFTCNTELVVSGAARRINGVLQGIKEEGSAYEQEEDVAER